MYKLHYISVSILHGMDQIVIPYDILFILDRPCQAIISTIIEGLMVTRIIDDWHSCFLAVNMNLHATQRYNAFASGCLPQSAGDFEKALRCGKPQMGECLGYYKLVITTAENG